MGLPNGKIRYWYDGKLLIASDSILMRTASHPNMKFNQLFYGPYIGVGSPVDQTWWVDDLTVMDGLPITKGDQQKKDDRSVLLFPNPSNGKFTITSKLDLNTVDIYNVLGAKVYAANLKPESSNEIDISGLSHGIYIVSISNGTTLFMRRIAIE